MLGRVPSFCYQQCFWFGPILHFCYHRFLVCWNQHKFLLPSTFWFCWYRRLILYFATTSVLVCWRQPQFLLPSGVLILRALTPNFAICYNWCFGLLEPAPIFATTAAFALLERTPNFAFLLQMAF
ncbi:hypothetical protein VPH35_112122 [Triticum aestivum]